MAKLSYKKILFGIRYPNQVWQRVICYLNGVIYKSMEVADFVSILPENPVIIEAGASRGMDTIKFAQTWPKAQIYAFEPEPSTFSILAQVTSGFENVTVYQFALSQDSGSAILNISSRADNSKATDASSLLKPTAVQDVWKELSFDNRAVVNTITLSDFFHNNKIEHVDLMWLDMQGMEIACLMASKDILSLVDRIYMEVSLIPLYEGAPLYPNVRKLMKGVGFYPVKEFLNPISGDVLFERMR